MGYTHYWRRPTSLPVRAFTRAAQDCRTVTEWLSRERGMVIRYETDNPTPPCFDATAIWFNGVGDDGHETFHVPRLYEPYQGQEGPPRGGWFEFCKTAWKPYDTAVCACLIVLSHHLGRKFRVSSDGDDDDEGWVLARLACQQAVGFGTDFTLKEPVRLGKAGLPYRRLPDLCAGGRLGRTVYRLADGQYLVRHHSAGSPGSGEDPGALVAVTTAPDTHPTGVIGRAGTVNEARWVATCEFISREFKGAPFINEFLSPAWERPGEWLGFKMWADKLDDAGSEFGPKLRALLPR